MICALVDHRWTPDLVVIVLWSVALAAAFCLGGRVRWQQGNGLAEQTRAEDRVTRWTTAVGAGMIGLVIVAAFAL